MASSVRERQIDVLKQMINFNQQLPDNSSLNEPTWKVLVYDRFGQDIISPLVSVKELRDFGVTINLILHSDRDVISDVPAVYFIQPSKENIERICQDFKNDLYEGYYLNFISPIPRSQLEDIAQAAIEAGIVHKIYKIYDQYLNFISLEDELFFLRNQDREPISYYALNRGDVKDSDMEMIVNTVVDSLFSVLVTLGTIPVIRCPKNTASEQIAEKLDKKLRENLRDTRNCLFNENNQLNFQRPVLLIIDRNFDLATPLHHTWTYQALIHDTLDLKLNRVEIKEEKKVYDLSCIDKFWSNQKGNPFPQVAEAIQEDLEEYKKKESELTSLKQKMGDVDTDDGGDLLADNTDKLTSAVSSLPELMRRKAFLDMHTTIATCLLDHIKKRKLDIYFEIEEKIMSRTSLEKSIMEILNDPDAGTPEDKVRLLIIYYICSSNISQTDLDQYLNQLQPTCNIECFKFIKRLKTICKMNSSQYSSDSATNTVNMFSNLLSKSSKFVMEGVKNFVVKQHKLPLTKILDNLMDLKSSPDTDEYRYFDPKLIRADSSNMPRTKTPFTDAIVFVVGGGNYIEYQNLLDNAKAKQANSSQKRIIYGCTEFLNASSLILQLTQIAKEI